MRFFRWEERKNLQQIGAAHLVLKGMPESGHMDPVFGEKLTQHAVLATVFPELALSKDERGRVSMLFGKLLN